MAEPGRYRTIVMHGLSCNYTTGWLAAKVRVKNGRKYAHNYDAARKINRGKNGSLLIIRELVILDSAAVIRRLLHKK